MIDKNSPHYVKSTFSDELHRYKDETVYEKKIEIEANTKKGLEKMKNDLTFWRML